MTEPIYSQVEIDAMLAAPKWMMTVDWDRSYADLPAVRQTLGERSLELEAFPDNPDSEMAFAVEFRQNTKIEAFSITLHGRIKPEGWQCLCRYDVHPTMHVNRDFCPGGEYEMLPGVLHRHVYNETALRRLGKWHSCTELIGGPAGSTAPERRELLKRGFVAFAKLKLVDRDVHKAVMGFGE